MWILIFLPLLIGYLAISDTQITDTAVIQQQSRNQALALQAQQTVRYINDLNDYRHDHIIADGVIDNALIGWPTDRTLSNIVSANRLFVYQKNQPGLLSALLDASHQSALIGIVVNDQLLDSSNNDMLVTVPSSIPNGSLVYLN